MLLSSGKPCKTIYLLGKVASCSTAVVGVPAIFASWVMVLSILADEPPGLLYPQARLGWLAETQY